ncbi:hypothetical protein H0H92_012052, partial [Tricholoma furcatifolium]
MAVCFTVVPERSLANISIVVYSATAQFTVAAQSVTVLGVSVILGDRGAYFNRAHPEYCVSQVRSTLCVETQGFGGQASGAERMRKEESAQTAEEPFYQYGETVI